jgi:hypothetical protein
MSRGVDRRWVFNDDEKERFLQIMRAAESFCGVEASRNARARCFLWLYLGALSTAPNSERIFSCSRFELVVEMRISFCTECWHVICVSLYVVCDSYVVGDNSVLVGSLRDKSVAFLEKEFLCRNGVE